jgi:hypothetical protein
LLEFRVNDVAVGERGSELRLSEPATVHLTANVAALLDATLDQPQRGVVPARRGPALVAEAAVHQGR